MAVNANSSVEIEREEARFGAYSRYYKEKLELVTDAERTRIFEEVESHGGSYDRSDAETLTYMETHLDKLKRARREQLVQLKQEMLELFNQGGRGRAMMVTKYSTTMGSDAKMEVYDYVKHEATHYDDNVKGLIQVGKDIKADKKAKKEMGEMAFMKDRGEIKLNEVQVLTDLDVMYIIDDVFEENCGKFRYLRWSEKECAARKRTRLPHFNPIKPNNLRRKINTAIGVVSTVITITFIVI